MPGRWYHNHFCPIDQAGEKSAARARARSSATTQPKTPYQRLLQSDVLESKKRAALQEQHAAINPFVLKRQIEAGLKEIQRLVRAAKRSGNSVTLVPSLRSGTRSTASPERRSKPNLTIKVCMKASVLIDYEATNHQLNFPSVSILLWERELCCVRHHDV